MNQACDKKVLGGPFEFALLQFFSVPWHLQFPFRDSPTSSPFGSDISSSGFFLCGPNLRMDDHGTFRTLMNDCGVSSVQMEHIVAMGYNTVSLLAHAVPEPDQLEPFVEHISLIPMGEEFQKFSPQTASLRRLVKECVEKVMQAGRQSLSEPPTPVPARSKLSAAEVKDMKQVFQQTYPGELLTAATTPSVAFLAIVKEAHDTNTFGWIPWKSRTSEQDELDYTETRKPRNDRALLRTLINEGSEALFDGPEATFQASAPVEIVLPKFQGLLHIALAMVGAAHLLVLKRFHSNFLHLAIARPRDSSLRPPSLTETLDADRQAWSAVGELMQEGKWSLNDSLNEIAFCRQIFHTALAPKPRAHLPQPRAEPKKRRHDDARNSGPPPKRKSPTRSKPKDSKNKSGASSKWQESWHRKTSAGQGICIRYNITKCRSKECRYSHTCPIPKADGSPCGGAHPASQHRSAPH